MFRAKLDECVYKSIYFVNNIEVDLSLFSVHKLNTIMSNANIRLYAFSDLSLIKIVLIT